MPRPAALLAAALSPALLLLAAPPPGLPPSSGAPAAVLPSACRGRACALPATAAAAFWPGVSGGGRREGEASGEPPALPLPLPVSARLVGAANLFWATACRVRWAFQCCLEALMAAQVSWPGRPATGCHKVRRPQKPTSSTKQRSPAAPGRARPRAARSWCTAPLPPQNQRAAAPGRGRPSRPWGVGCGWVVGCALALTAEFHSETSIPNHPMPAVTAATAHAAFPPWRSGHMPATREPLPNKHAKHKRT